MTRGAIVVVLVLGAMGVANAQDQKLDTLRWLAGCWESVSPQRTIEEQWTAPRGGTMLGVGRTVRGGHTVDHEFVVIRVEDGKLVYEAHPAGQSPALFIQSVASADRVVFENASHDYPQEVGYERRGIDSLLAWIDGSDAGRSRRVEFDYHRVSCAGTTPGNR